MRICYKCKIEKPESDFYKSSHTNGGLSSYCKKCHNKWTMDRKRIYKERLVEKFGNKCEKCGYDKCIGALEFHHVDPSTKDLNFKDIMRNASFEKMEKAVDGCILLCSNCHKEIHYLS